jgi:hypothetical protein
MTLFLASGISYGKLSDATVVLDLRRDRYFRLGTCAAEALDALERRDPFFETMRRGLTALIDAGLVTDDAAARPVAPVGVKRPTISALEELRTSDARLSLLSITLFHCAVRMSLAFGGLARTVDWLRRKRAETIFRDDPLSAVAIAQSYARVRQLLPGKRACVPESFTLALLLMRKGVAHDVVFGVSLTPFAAHAWTQCETHILSDRADPVRAFHPVFVL